MSTDTTSQRRSFRHGFGQTAQLLRMAEKDTDAVSVFYDCAEDERPARAILVVKGEQHVEDLYEALVAAGLVTRGKRVTR